MNKMKKMGEMKKMDKIKMIVVAMIATVFTLVGCQPAEAATLPIDVTLGYMDSKLIDQDGVRLDVGTEYNNIRFGLTSFTSDKRLESYGAYAALPIKIQNTKFAVTPQVRVEDYRNIGTTMGSVGLGLEYAFTDTIRADVVGLVNRSLERSGMSSETYMVGLTKTF